MIEQSAYDSLAEKLDSLELTADEAAVLDGLVAAAATAEPEVRGYQRTELQRSPVFEVNGVKCDVHPWIIIQSAKTDRHGVVINHEEQ
mgnify:CR=1 FL=1